ncbi:hypothetical protein GCM10010458_22790 [Microbacterium luteolum]|uniref:MoaD/ThiS family protein n=1 Tax=Microbacterium luteolum TaxID=69367 RepID=A0ABY7XVE5_MICLT|nr:hypothetical protein [Microbacterium luteolum]WDM44932.1 hypothetical protein KV395_17485 [Microbacterium luteolum]
MQIELRGVAEACLDRSTFEIERQTPFSVEDIFRDLGELDSRIERAFINAETKQVNSYARILVDGKVARPDDQVDDSSRVMVCVVAPCDG